MAEPVFLSYSWDDLDEVDMLDDMLRFRGVPVWRDRRGMRWGRYNKDLVRGVIESESSGFAFYLTESSLASSFVTTVELPAMASRRSRDRAYFAGGVFRGYDFGLGARAVHDTTGIDIGAAFSSRVKDDQLQGHLREAANAILLEYVRTQWTSGAVTVHLETRDPLPVGSPALLHLSLAPPLAHDPDRFDASVWDERVLPALDDLQRALHTAEAEVVVRERTVELDGRSHLSMALALGYAFREATGWKLRIRQDDRIWEARREPGELGGWEVSKGAGSGDDGDLVVVVHISADATNAARASGYGLARVTLDVRPPDGPNHFSLEPARANAIASGIAKTIREVRSEHAPVRIRLYVAAPWPFAALLGWHLGSCGAVVMHEATLERDSYLVSCTLR